MKNEKLERLRRDLEEWSRQESRLSASAARERIMARLEAGNGRRGWLFGVAAAVAAAAAILLATPWNREAQPVTPAATGSAPTSRLLVYELRSGTTLYLPLPIDSTGEELEGGQG